MKPKPQKHPDELRECSVPLANPGRRDAARQRREAKAECSELPHPPSPSKQSPAKRVCFEKEEGGSGYAAFTAPSETVETEWSELLLTRGKAAANHVLAQDLCTHTGPDPVTLNIGG